MLYSTCTGIQHYSYKTHSIHYLIYTDTDTDTDTLLTKKHGPRKALMTYMYRWHKCQFTRSHITNNKNIIVYINSNFYHNIWHFSHIILYQYINTSVSPCTLVCYTYWLTCRQKQGNAIYGVRTVISININHTKLCISGYLIYKCFILISTDLSFECCVYLYI